ncbi:MAG: M23 family metallopeptidase [bacterium]|nr:M23 family metallopeptidase [bacterium]
MMKIAHPKRWGIVTLLGVAALTAALAWFRVGPPPEIEIVPGLPGIGRLTEVEVRVAEPQRGLSRVRVEVAQGELLELLAESDHEPRPFWAFWGPRVQSDEISAEVGSQTLEGLVEGEATIRVTAERAPTWLRRPEPAVREIILPVRLTPPTIAVASSQIYLAQGGSSVVVYQVGTSAVRDGVRVGGYWFPGYPLPGGVAGQRFALFGAPHDLEDSSEVRLAAADDVGNELAIEFLDRYLRKPLRTDTIRLSDRFMARVAPEIVARSPQVEDQGDLLETYLAINRDLRRANSEELLELASRTAPKFLWRQPFRQLPNTQSMASFADRRTYLYEDREVDQQDHLGFDLASVRHAPVLAANAGVVLEAEYFGIYGNTVILDHGHGLMSLYAHLSAIEVQAGQEVARGQSLGKTGETGLAGGDHLHFSMLLHGLQVNPLEWWDPKWIENRFASKLGAAFEFEG